MPATSNPRLFYAHTPSGIPVPGETTVYDPTPTVDLDNVPLDGGVLIKALVLSADPFLRARMRDPSVKGFFPPFNIGER